jgi:hypothetical protein
MVGLEPSWDESQLQVVSQLSTQQNNFLSFWRRIANTRQQVSGRNE